MTVIRECGRARPRRGELASAERLRKLEKLPIHRVVQHRVGLN